MRSVPVRGDKSPIPVGKILCLGKNFAAHAREMGETKIKPPVVFLKPASAILLPGEPIILPPFSTQVHHEVELVVAVGKQGKNIPEREAIDHVLGYAVGLDLTARDIQAQAKRAGEPWTLSKGFDGAAPLSEIVPKEAVSGGIASSSLTLRVNGALRQKASLSEMIWTVPRTLSYLTTFFTLDRGDLIFMGTPEGVGPVRPGDRLTAEIEGWVSVEFQVTGE